jgi:hypothetical protein
LASDAVSRSNLGSLAANPAHPVEEALDVVGRLAGLEDRDGQVDERVDRRTARSPEPDRG